MATNRGGWLMAANDKDPLAGLLLDSTSIDRSRIATALQGKVGIDRATGRVVLQPGFHGMNVRQKALAYFLGRKVAVLLGVEQTEGATSAELAADTGLPEGSARPTTSGLAREHRLTKVGGLYHLSPA